MLALVAVHDNASFGLQFPRALVHVEYYHVHAQVECSLLSAQAGAQAVVEEDEQGGLVASQVLVLKAVGLDLERLIQGCREVTQVGYMLKYFHRLVL